MVGCGLLPTKWVSYTPTRHVDNESSNRLVFIIEMTSFSIELHQIRFYEFHLDEGQLRCDAELLMAPITIPSA